MWDTFNPVVMCSPTQYVGTIAATQEKCLLNYLHELILMDDDSIILFILSIIFLSYAP